MIRRVLFAVFVLGMSVVLASGASAGEPDLRVTYNPMPFNVPSMIEHDQQFLAELGMDVEYNTFLAGYAMTEAMAANELDIAAVMGGTSAIVSKAGGRDIRAFQVYSQAPEAFALVARPGEFSLQDLEGARVGLPQGTEAHYLLARIVDEKGLSMEDVELVNLMVPDAVSALQSGEIHAAVVVEPVLSRLTAAERIEVIRDGQGLIAGLTLSVVRTDFLGEPGMEAFIDAHKKSLAWLEENPDQAVELAAEEADLPEQLAEELLGKYSFDTEITEDVRSDLEKAAAFLYEEGLIRRQVDIDALFYP